MMLTIDFIAKRYGRLPSEVLVQATTFDLEVGLLAAEYSAHQYEEASGVKKPARPELTQEQMLAMIERVNNGKTKG